MSETDSYINDEFLNFNKNTDEGQGVCPTDDEIEKMHKLNQFKKEILNKSEYIKALLVIGIKDFTWRNELENDYNMSNNHVSLFLNSMKYNGLVAHKLLSELDNIQFEAITKTRNINFFSKTDKVSILVLTNKGKEFTKEVLQSASKLFSTRDDLRLVYNEVTKKSKTYKDIVNNILDEENTFFERDITYANGIKIIRDTQRAKDVKRIAFEVRKQNLLEKQTQGLITSQENKQLAIIEDKGHDLINYEEKPDITKGCKTNYKGIYSHLTTSEVEDLSEGVTNQEVKDIEKQYQKDLKDHIKKLNKTAMLEDGGRWVANGFHGEKTVKSTNNDEALDFLDNLI